MNYPWLEPDDPRLSMTREEVITNHLKFKDTMLTTEQQEEIRNIVPEYNEAFSTHSEIGCLHDFEIHLQTKKDFKPFIQRPYPIATAHFDRVRKEIKNLIAQGVIERGKAICYTARFVQPKPESNSLRLIADLRSLNHQLVVSHHPLISRPELHVKLATQRNTQFLTTLHFTNAFCSLQLDEESRQLLGLNIASFTGLRLTRLPMGSSISLSVWCECLAQVLSGVTGERDLSMYCDDLIISSKNYTSHKENLRTTLERMAQSGLKLNLTKSQFGARCTKILGFLYTVTEDGLRISIPQSKIDTAK